MLSKETIKPLPKHTRTYVFHAVDRTLSMPKIDKTIHAQNCFLKKKKKLDY
jgi:hypothetical protein